jgi:glycosyltransferase involved in cell wall biosynthesis
MRQRRARISVCVATYNQVRYIEDAVLSAVAQAVDADLEVLVGDDASTDGTGEVLEALARRFQGVVHVIRRVPNLGPAGNYQDLVRRASGDYIAHLDGDDAWLPGKLRAQMTFLEANPTCPAVYTNAISVDPAGGMLGAFTNSHEELMSLKYICGRGNFLMHSSTMYRAQWKEDFLRLRAPLIDYAIHLSFAARGPLGFIDRPLACYRVDTDTSLVRNAFPWVQRQLWHALRDVLPSLTQQERRSAAAHFAAQAMLSRIFGRTATLWSLLDDISAEIGSSRAGLLFAAVPAAISIFAHGSVRTFLRNIGADARMALHYRI